MSAQKDFFGQQPVKAKPKENTGEYQNLSLTEF